MEDIEAGVLAILKHFEGELNPNLLREIARNILSLPDPIYSQIVAPPSVEMAVHYIENFQILDSRNFGWLRRDGVFIGCAYGNHERLLYWLSMTATDAEEEGWCRVSITAAVPWQCLYRLSPAQRRYLKNCGHVVDNAEELQKPIWGPKQKSRTNRASEQVVDKLRFS